MNIEQCALFGFILLITAIMDILTHKIKTATHIMLLFLILLKFCMTASKFYQGAEAMEQLESLFAVSIQSALFCSVPFIIAALVTQKSPTVKIGMGDAKLIFMCAFFVGNVAAGLIAVAISCILQILIMLFKKYKLRKNSETAMAPAIGIGFMAVAVALAYSQNTILL